MKKYSDSFILFIAAILFVSLPTAITARECVSNKEILEVKKSVRKSYSQKYIDKFNKVINKARQYAEKHYEPRAAIIFDIDETLLDNREYYAIYKIFDEESWKEWVNLADAIPYQKTAAFLNWAKEKGYYIVLITGRVESQREATEANLKKYNIPYDRLFLRPDEYNIDIVSNYKRNTRQKLSNEGYRIILNIGDQKSDLRGGFGKGFKLPNPIYTIP
jgi:5'-nucleotidase (lipoprotein e(P4) family)